MAKTEIQLVRVKIDTLPRQLTEDLFDIWNARLENEFRDIMFSDFIEEYFNKKCITVQYHDIGSMLYNRDEIELSEKDLTWLQLKYS